MNFVRRARTALMRLGLLLVAGALLGIALLFWRGNQPQEMDAELKPDSGRTSQVDESSLLTAIEETNRLDPKWRLEDFPDLKKKISDADNGALLILAARKRYPRSWNGKGLDQFIPSTLPANQQLTNEQATQLREELARLKPALVELRKLTRYTTGRFPATIALNPMLSLLPHVQAVRTEARLLSFDAMRLAHDGEIDAALTSGRAILHAGRTIGAEPYAIVQLVRMALYAITVQSIQRTLGMGEPSRESLTVLIRQLGQEISEPLVLLALRGERAMVHNLMHKVESGELLPTSLPSELILSNVDQNTAGMLLTPSFQHSHVWFLRHMNRQIEIASQPMHQQLKAFQKFESEIRNSSTFARMILMDTGRLVFANLRSQALLRSTCVALAADQYRLDNQHWPDSLKELVPKYVTELYNDPFTGEPLRYKRLEDGVVIYSVGTDGDNDGRLATQVIHPGTDYGFRLWNVNQRRVTTLESRNTKKE